MSPLSQLMFSQIKIGNMIFDSVFIPMKTLFPIIILFYGRIFVQHLRRDWPVNSSLFDEPNNLRINIFQFVEAHLIVPSPSFSHKLSSSLIENLIYQRSSRGYRIGTYTTIYLHPVEHSNSIITRSKYS